MLQNNRPYIEPSIRVIFGVLIIINCVMALLFPDLITLFLSIVLLFGIALLKSGFSRPRLMEKLLKYFGFRSEMDEILSLALHDALTNLPNRVLLEDRIEIAISQAKRTNKKVAMLFIDLDNFKQVNDIYGHKSGDRLLIAVSKALKSHLRPYDTLARWGGDEFVVLLRELNDTKDIHAIAEKLMASIDSKLLPEQDIQTTLSIGAAVFPNDADSTESLLIQADKALFYSKSRGRNNIQIFSEIQETNHGFLNFGLTTRFAEAVKNKQLQVHYQPIVSSETGKVTCIEALARWYDDKNGWVSPIMFIPLAEDMGLIEELGLQIFETALTQYSKYPWNNSVKLAINVSNRQLFSTSFFTTITNLVKKHYLTPDQIKIEITESIALDTNKARETLQELSNAGFYISLDDFGTGFSSLSRLHELPFNELKIDMSFVRRIATKEGKIMLKTIIDMGKAMKLNLVAEGVEIEESVQILRMMGVQNLQGYYFSHPKSHVECNTYIINSADNQSKTLFSNIELKHKTV